MYLAQQLDLQSKNNTNPDNLYKAIVQRNLTYTKVDIDEHKGDQILSFLHRNRYSSVTDLTSKTSCPAQKPKGMVSREKLIKKQFTSISYRCSGVYIRYSCKIILSCNNSKHEYMFSFTHVYNNQKRSKSK
jgi:hypothetical protein